MYRPSPNVVAQAKYGPMIVNVHDRIIGRSIITTGIWDEANVLVIARLAETILETKPSVRIYDVGANIGTHSLAWAKLLGDRADIRAFEAQSAVFQMLCGTLALNGIDSVIPHLNVVSDTVGEPVPIALPDYSVPNNLGGLELRTPHASDSRDLIFSGRTEFVPSVTIDSFEEEIDIIKIDIEGMEIAALRGAADTIARSRPIILLEVAKSDPAELEKFFGSRDYDMAVHGNDAICSPAERRLRFR